jgi:hypothetical protein
MRSSLRRFHSLRSGYARVQRRVAADLRADPQAAIDIEAHSRRNRFDQIDIKTQAIAQARKLFLLFDALMRSAQRRRAPVREIDVRRKLGGRARAGASRRRLVPESPARFDAIWPRFEDQETPE